MKTILEYIDYQKVIKNPFEKLNESMRFNEIISIFKKSSYKEITRAATFVGRMIDAFDKDKQQYAILKYNNRNHIAVYNKNHNNEKIYLEIGFDESDKYVKSQIIEISDRIIISGIPINSVKEYLSK
jgi:hypothetical protein